MKIPKWLTRDEANALETPGGLKRVTAAEYLSAKYAHKPTSYTRDQGQQDAESAFKAANEAGQPEHSPIYFAIDVDHPTITNLSPRSLTFVDDYLAGVKRGYDEYIKESQTASLTVIPYSIGVYGVPEVLERAYLRGSASYFWMSLESEASAPYHGGNVWKHANLLQRANNHQTEIPIPNDWQSDPIIKDQYPEDKLRLDYDASWGDEGSWPRVPQ